jgi:hypothetical protein
MERWAPRFADRYKQVFMFDQQRARQRRGGEDSLYEPVPGDGRTRGSHRGHVMGSSIYTSMRLSPVGRTVLRAAGVGLALALVIGVGSVLDRPR